MLFDKLKKNKLKVISITIIISIIFSGSIVVFGNYKHNGLPGQEQQAGSCGGTNCIYNTSTGVRFSLVDENGKQVSGTKHIDVWWIDQIKTLAIYKNRYSFDNYNIGKNDAYYGTGIKQNVMASGTGCTTIGISQGDYFARSDVLDVYSVFPSFSTYSGGYDRDSGNWGYYLAKWLQNVSSKNSATDVNSLLEKMGYKSTSDKLDAATSAAVANYYIQYEPIIMIGRHGSAVKNTAVVMIATITELAKYDCSGGVTNTNNGFLNVKATTGVHIGTNMSAPSNFTSGSDYVPNAIAYDSNGKIIGEGVAHLWMRDIIKLDIAPCEEAIAHIHKKSSLYPLGSDAYHNAVAQVRNGTFKYTDDNGILREVQVPQTHDFLKKNIYMKYNNGVAACANVKTEVNDCTTALDYIHANNELYPLGTPAYHNAVSQIREGTFSYEIENASGELIIKKIDKAYNNSTEYAMLLKENYEKRGGKAECGPIPLCNVTGTPEIVLDPCVTGRTFFGDINDPEAWLVCETAYTKNGTVYSSDNTGHDAYETTNGGIVGNAEYCEVFCYESFETDFPTNVYNVKAGQTFQWGSSLGNFGTVKVTKKCSNQSYVYGQQGYRFVEWQQDYKNNERKMITFYMNKASYEKQIPIITTSSSGKYTACPECDDEGNCHNTCDYRYKGTAKATSQNKSYSHNYIGSVTGKADARSYSTGYSYTSASDAENAAKTTLISQLNALASAEEAKYSGKKIDEAELLVKIRQCTNNLEYLYKTTVQFTFKEPVNSVYGVNTRNFSFNDYLNVDGDYNTDNVDTSKCKVVNAYSYTCTGTGSSAKCTPKVEKVLDCELVTWDLTGEYTYSYPMEEFQWYSLKTDSTLINKKDKAKIVTDEAFFYYIGFGLPTAFSLTNGTYELKAIVSNLGDNAATKGTQDYNIPNGHFAPVAESVTTKVGTGYGFEYICYYEVENEMFGYDCTYDENGNLIYESPEYCDEKEDEDSDGSLVGIDVTYRLVTLLSQDDVLAKAFPGINGAGREPGSNWNPYAHESKISTLELKDILDANVYEDDQAMYEIMLDINAINYIREDNEKYFNSNIDPYTSYYDENNSQKVYCAVDETGNEKYCASDFISVLNRGTYLNYPLLGTCLPTDNTLPRAEYILKNGCDTLYEYEEIDWRR